MAKGKLQRKCTLQRAPLQEPATGSVPPVVHEVLNSPGRMLDTGTRAFMEPRFSYDFSNVRVHTDARAAESAAAVSAQAYTVGRDIVFGEGGYAPEQPAGQQLLAHELTHVMQQQRAPAMPQAMALKLGPPGDAAEIEAERMAHMAVSGEHMAAPALHAQPATKLMRQATELGTSKTTSPIAKLSPRTEMLDQLTDETTLFNNARVIIDWVLKKAPQPAAGGTTATTSTDPVSFSADELIKDKVVVKKLKPVPKKEEELTPMLEILITYGIIERAAATGTAGSTPTFVLKNDPQTKLPDLSSFTKDKQNITKFQTTFKQRQQHPSSLDPVVATSILPKDMAAGAADEFKTETQAETNLGKLKLELETLNASGVNDEKTQKKQAELQAKIEKAEKTYTRAQGFHTFAADVANLLLRLRKINTTWKAGTYGGHSWGEFSADIFLSASMVNVKDAGEYSGNFWDRKVVKQFFDDLNTVAEEEDPTTGKFAWRALYNDIPLAAEINKKYGAGRVNQKENHGPEGHKLHIHLDLRPVKQRLDSQSGYEMNKGRIKLLP